MEPLLYAVPEVCQATRLKKSKVWELISSGEIPSVKIGRSRRVPADALKAWVDQQIAAAEAERAETPQTARVA